MRIPLDRDLLVDLLTALGQRLIAAVEVTLVGGSAGMLTGQLPAARTTLDCDVIRAEPADRYAEVRAAALELARERGLPEEWFSDQVAELDVLPTGWRRRRVEIGTFGRLRVWSVGRLDLLAMKV